MKEKKINPMGLLLKWAGKDRKWIILSVLCGFISGILGIGAYIGIYRLMDALVSGSCNGQVVVDNAILITTTVILRHIFLGTSGVLSHKGAYGALFTVRCMVTEHLSKVPLGALNEKRTGDMKTVLNEDIEKLERGLAHNLPEFVSYFVGPFVIFFYLLSVNVELALISLIPLLFVIGIMVLMFARMMKVMDRASESARDFNSVIIEYIHGMRLIKAYNMGSESFGKFRAAIISENDLWKEMSIKTGPLYAAFNIALECGMVFLVPIGGRMFLNSSIPASVFLLFAYVGSMYLTEILPLQQLAMELAQVFAGVGKVKEILDIPVFDGEKPFPDKQDITLEDVTFAYDKEKENVLEHASMSMKQGEKVAIVGRSGAGKSTIIQLISRFYEADKGNVCIGGVNVKHINYEELLKHIAIVFQNNFMTSGTVLENIRMSSDASLEQVRKAAKEAQIDDYIMSLPEQYNTKMVTIAARFSGGEKQRIAIARAILKNAPILILDEATSSIDTRTEKIVQDGMDKLMAGRTTFVIAHRLSTVRNSDCIIVLEQGRVIERGSHDQLIEKHGKYYQLYTGNLAEG